MRQDKTGEILHCCPTGMLFAAGNAVLGRKVANITSFTVMLTLWAFACGLFFVFSIIHIELKWQCFSVLFTSLMNRLKKKKKVVLKIQISSTSFSCCGSSVLHSIWFRQMHLFHQRVSVPKGARFKQTCQRAHALWWGLLCWQVWEKHLNANIISCKTNPQSYKIWVQSHWQQRVPEINSQHFALCVQRLL